MKLSLRNSLLYVTVIIYILSVTECCRYPPSLWCSSREIARSCKVEEQCSHFQQRELSTAAPVNLTLYFESLCGGCRMFIKSQLGPTYKKIASIMNLNLVPYGNAMEQKKGTKYVFTCQHGPLECVGNLIETCAIHLLHKVSLYFPFILCIEDSPSGDPPQDAKRCAKSLGIELNPIMKCANGSEGNYLEHQMAQRTGALDPPHKFVPWVTLNGVHTDKIQEEAQDNLLKLICDMYQGPKPSACTEATDVCPNV